MTTFPDGFLWGASTAPHQIEGNNVNSDWWAREQQMPGMELSGDACDSYHRYGEDITLLADAGLDAYRFGIEWARIEPIPGRFSRAELAHYRRMIDTCLARGITPVVTLQHFTTPQWFAAAGGWEAPDASRFVAYVTEATAILEGVEWVATMNEPNMQAAIMTAMRRMQQATDGQWQSPTVEAASGPTRSANRRHATISSPTPTPPSAATSSRSTTPRARCSAHAPTPRSAGRSPRVHSPPRPAARTSFGRSATARRTSSGRAAAAMTGSVCRPTRARRWMRTVSSRIRRTRTTPWSAPRTGRTRSRWPCATPPR